MDAIEAYRNGNYQKIYEKWGSIVKYVDYLPIEIETSDNQTNGIEPFAAYVSKGVTKGNLAFIAHYQTNFEFTIKPYCAITLIYYQNAALGLNAVLVNTPQLTGNSVTVTPNTY